MGSKLTHCVRGTRCMLTVIKKKKKKKTSSPGWGSSQTGSYQNIGDNAGSTVPVRAAACLGHTTHEKESRYCYMTCSTLSSNDLSRS